MHILIETNESQKIGRKSMKDAEEIIDQRKKKALEKGLDKKIKDIVYFLKKEEVPYGNPYNTVKQGELTIRGYDKNDDGIQMITLEVFVKDERVLDLDLSPTTPEKVQGYIPGKWEDTIEKMYLTAKKIRDEREEYAKPLSKEQKQMKEWEI